MSDTDFVKPLQEEDTEALIDKFAEGIINDMSVVTMSYIHGFVNRHTKASIAIRENLEKDIESHVVRRMRELKTEID